MITKDGRMTLRLVKGEDYEALEGLFKQTYPHENWTKRCFTRFYAKRGAKNIIKVLGCEDNDLVYGAIFYSIERRKCRIRRVAVWPEFQRQGLATFMLANVVHPRSRIERIMFEIKVHERNLSGLLLLRSKKLNFTFDPETPREKDENREDWYVFTHIRAEALAPPGAGRKQRERP